MLATQQGPDPAAVVTEALLNSAKMVGLKQAELTYIVGRSRSRLRDGFDPKTKEGELALLFIRAVRSLAVLMGNDKAMMQHWMQTDNRHLNGVPAELTKSVQGLNEVTRYLDAMRGKV